MKWIVLLLTVFTLSRSFAEVDLPLPLPDEPGHSQPEPYPPGPNNPEPYPSPAPQPPEQQPQPPSGPSTNYSMGVGDTGRFMERTFTFYPSNGWMRITRISLRGTRNNIKIKSAIIRYTDYSSDRYEYNLTGELKAGGSMQALLDGRSVMSVEIVAANKYFWKKPGAFRVDVTAYQH